MLKVALPSHSLIGGFLERMSNVDSRNHEKRRGDHSHQNHSHHAARRRHSIGHEGGGGSAGKKRPLDKTGSSNTRPHPRLEASSNNFDHTPSRSVDRKRKIRAEAEEGSEDVWTEHKSSSGKIYYYNKRLDKSQWEKPEKGVLKRLKSDKTTPKSSTDASHSKTHSTTGSVKKELNVHRHGDHHSSSQTRHSSHHHRDGGHSKKSSINNTSSTLNLASQSISGSSPSTPVSNSVLSPNGPAPITPIATCGSSTPFGGRKTSITHSGISGSGQYASGAAPESPLMTSSQHPSLFVGVAHPTGPVTPIMPSAINYGKGLIGASPVPVPSMEMGPTVRHSQQHPPMVPPAAMQQYSQVYTTSPGAKPLPHALPNSPAPSIPGSIAGTGQLINNYPSYYHHPLSTAVVHSEALSVTSQTFQSPMSKLGHWVNGIPPNEIKLPDPESLQTLPHLPAGTNDILSKVLAERMWTGQFDGIQKQIEHIHVESLSRSTVDYSYHCGQLARGLLSLECSRIKEVSRSVRLTDLKAIRETVEKR